MRHSDPCSCGDCIGAMPSVQDEQSTEPSLKVKLATFLARIEAEAVMRGAFDTANEARDLVYEMLWSG